MEVFFSMLIWIVSMALEMVFFIFFNIVAPILGFLFSLVFAMIGSLFHAVFALVAEYPLPAFVACVVVVIGVTAMTMLS